MADSALSSLTLKLLLMVSSPDFKEAYENGRLFWEPKDELDKLKCAIQTIHDGLFGAEQESEGSVVAKNWIERARDVLYEADNLFDVVATDFLHKQQYGKQYSLSERVRSSLSKLNPTGANQSKKAVRKRLDQIARDLAHLKYSRPLGDNVMGGLGEQETTPCGSRDTSAIVGRADDVERLVNYLCQPGLEQSVSVIAIVGVAGIGKTTLAQLVYNRDDVQNYFEQQWWACIGRGDILQSIAASITVGREFSHAEDPAQLISQSVSRCGKYLLVLDDVRLEDASIWLNIMSLLRTGAKGSMIMITTRGLPIATAAYSYICELRALATDDAWELFKRIAFPKEIEEIDPNLVSLGKDILRKSGGIPLAIHALAGLFSTNFRIEQYAGVENKILQNSDPPLLYLLRLSYGVLQSNLKLCVAYFSVFPEDHIILKEKLICLWIAQGYVKLGDHTTLEEAGHAHFMELWSKGFIQVVEVYDNGDIISCTVHDLIRELAQNVAGEELYVLTSSRNQIPKRARHVNLVYETDDLWNEQLPLHESNQVSSLFISGISCSLHFLDEQVTKLMYLHALDLHALNIETLPSSIKKLMYLRYLDLSDNTFSNLPDSITTLVNLLILDISNCLRLEALPNDFRKLINLRHLYINDCDSLWHMPPGFGELPSLVLLSEFKVSRHHGSYMKSSGLDALATLKLRGNLRISWKPKCAWHGDDSKAECSYIADAIQVLTVSDWPNMRIPCWWKETGLVVTSKLQHLVLIRCKKAKQLPPLKCLPYLRILQLFHFPHLECIEQNDASSTAAFFPMLEKLELVNLPKLKQWSSGREEARFKAQDEEINMENPVRLQFCRLSHLEIKSCNQLNSIPPSPCLKTLHVEEVREELVKQLVSTCSLAAPSSSNSSSVSSPLWKITISWCHDLTIFPGEGLTRLEELRIRNCTSLKTLQLPPNKPLLRSLISECPNLDPWHNLEHWVEW